MTPSSFLSPVRVTRNTASARYHLRVTAVRSFLLAPEAVGSVEPSVREMVW